MTKNEDRSSIKKTRKSNTKGGEREKHHLKKSKGGQRKTQQKIN